MRYCYYKPNGDGTYTVWAQLVPFYEEPVLKNATKEQLFGPMSAGVVMIPVQVEIA